MTRTERAVQRRRMNRKIRETVVLRRFTANLRASASTGSALPTGTDDTATVGTDAGPLD
jgi:hypothetical protein